MRITNTKQYQDHPLDGQQPDVLWCPGGGAVDGDAAPYVDALVGSMASRRVEDGHSQLWVKVKDDENDNDWALFSGVISQTVSYTDFTDGGGAAGTLVLTPDLPAGAVVDFVTVRDVTGFAGDTSATLTVGDGTDADRYNTGTPSVFSTASFIDMGPPSGNKEHTSAMATVTLTVTSNSDFTSVSAGALTINIHYRI